jgi:hypothetical protein
VRRVYQARRALHQRKFVGADEFPCPAAQHQMNGDR